jgi:hypothetical protein
LRAAALEAQRCESAAPSSADRDACTIRAREMKNACTLRACAQ